MGIALLVIIVHLLQEIHINALLVHLILVLILLIPLLVDLVHKDIIVHNQDLLLLRVIVLKDITDLPELM